jgi:hypothetical protein
LCDDLWRCDTQPNDTQRNDIQHNDALHKVLICLSDSQHK